MARVTSPRVLVLAGTGYFTFRVADAVGSAGSIAALDVAPSCPSSSS